MKIRRLKGVHGAKNATGLVVIVDIMRAATVEAYAFGQGAKFIIPVSTKKEALALRNKYPEYLLMGESDGVKIDEFDLGNSPSEITKADLTNRILVHKTSGGTQGLVSAISAKELIFGSFVTSSSIVKYIESSNHEIISIVAIDDEDTIFADYLEGLLNFKERNVANVKELLYAHPGTLWYKDHLKPGFPLSDINLALNFDKFNFICLVERKNNTLVTRKFIVP